MKTDGASQWLLGARLNFYQMILPNKNMTRSISPDMLLYDETET